MNTQEYIEQLKKEEWEKSNLYPINRIGEKDKRYGDYIADWWIAKLLEREATLWKMMEEKKQDLPASNFEENDFNAGKIEGFSDCQVLLIKPK